MKLSFYPETDTLYIELATGVAVDATEVSDGVVADFDAGGRLLGLEIEGASARVDVQRLELTGLPIARLLAA